MFGLGTREIILLAVLLVLFFGAKKVSNLAREVGEAIKYLRKSFKDDNGDEKG